MGNRSSTASRSIKLRWANSRRRAALVIVAAGLFAAGCGTTSVKMMVVRPALINARPWGGTVSVQGVAAAHPDYIHVAGQIRQELKQRIVNGYGNVVALKQYGGGLQVSGRLERYDITLEVQSRQTTCSDTIRVRQGGKSVSQRVSRPCVMKQHRWRAHVDVLMRVTSNNGQVLFLRHLTETRTGSTVERRAVAPMPDSHRILQGLRNLIVTRMAQVIVPHRVRVTATLYDCPQPAEGTCNRAVANLAKSRYDAALAEYDRALAQLQKAPGVERSDIAKVHWNKAIVCRYGRRFDAALNELDSALRLDPGNSRYQRERANVQADRDRHSRLIDQGLGAP